MSRFLRRRSLLARMMLSHAIIAIAVAGVCAIFLLSSLFYSEDRAYRRLVEQVARTALDSLHDSSRPMNIPDIQLFGPNDALPPELEVRIQAGNDQIFEVEAAGIEQHVAVVYDQNGNRMISWGSFPETSAGRLPYVVLCGVLLCAVGGLSYGFFHVRRALRPAVRLADALSRESTNPFQHGFGEEFGQDEIGVIANRLQHFVSRNQDVLRREQRFVGEVSHELRTPLAVLQGATELLREDENSSPSLRRERIGRMERSIKRMRRTVESLLSLARLENDNACAPQPPLTESLEELCEEMRSYMATGVILKVDIEEEVSLPGEVHLWIIAIRNLMDNAIRHTSQGKVTLVVSSDLIRVADTGSGIALELQDGITEDWIRGTESDGMGLGLSIAKRIVTRLEWQLELQSEINEGTTIVLRPVTQTSTLNSNSPSG